MQYINHYKSPMGSILLAADETGITGLWFDGAKYYARGLGPECKEKALPVFEQAKQWLTIYFSGREPHFYPPVHLTGTPFQLSVWTVLQKIPYGKTVAYGEIAKEIMGQKGLSRMSAQAVGGAVGHNKISIIVPCHRVVGTNGCLTGYAGGIDRKVRLLTLENVDMQHLFIPTKGTAL
nr:methylated-DNA--[protein]-cysteine S-methyltransferase [uncultured Acetatifactor sp.]